MFYCIYLTCDETFFLLLGLDTASLSDEMLSYQVLLAVSCTVILSVHRWKSDLKSNEIIIFKADPQTDPTTKPTGSWESFPSLWPFWTPLHGQSLCKAPLTVFNYFDQLPPCSYLCAVAHEVSFGTYKVMLILKTGTSLHGSPGRRCFWTIFNVSVCVTKSAATSQQSNQPMLCISPHHLN